MTAGIRQSKLTIFSDCPKCGTSWLGPEITNADREYYSPPYFYSRLFFCGMFWQCPDCGAKFKREQIA